MFSEKTAAFYFHNTKLLPKIYLQFQFKIIKLINSLITKLRQYEILQTALTSHEVEINVIQQFSSTQKTVFINRYRHKL